MPLSVIHLLNLRESPTFAPFSGAENHLWTLLPECRKAGLRVELGVMLEESGPRIDAKLEELREAGIEVTRFPYRPRHWYCYPYHHFLDPACVLALRRHLRTRRDWIIHTHLDRADVHGKTAAWLAGCHRVVSSVHNNEPSHLRPKMLFLMRALDRLTDHHIAISEAVRRHLVEGERVSAEKVTVIPYGVPPPTRVRSRAELREKLGLPKDGFVVGFVGRLVEQKNVELLLAALARRPDWLGIILGDGDQRAQLERGAAALGNVRFLGHNPDAADMMPMFDVLCLPSRWEGLGLVLVEAMLRGVPVIGSRAGAIPEILGNGEYGALFGPDDVNGLVAAIEMTRASGCATAAKARDYALATFTVNKMIERTLRVYETLLSTKKAP